MISTTVLCKCMGYILSPKIYNTSRDISTLFPVWAIILLVPISGSRSLSKSCVDTFFELVMVKNPRFAVGISMLAIIIRYIYISGLGGHIAVSSPPSQSLGDTLFELAMVENLEFVTWMTIILIYDLFYRVSQRERKISPVSKKIGRVWRHV